LVRGTDGDDCGLQIAEGRLGKFELGINAEFAKEAEEEGISDLAGEFNWALSNFHLALARWHRAASLGRS